MSLSLTAVTSLSVHGRFESIFFYFNCATWEFHICLHVTVKSHVNLMLMYIFFFFFFSYQVFGLIAGLLFAYDTYTIYLQIKSSRQHTAASTGEAAHTHWHCVFIYYTLIKVQLHQNVPNWNLNCFFLSCLDDRV